ncbi:hypothetical protein D2917_00010 [Cupriavidus oxalaticus]|uniref:Uncharacterized protein n=1 Tax=Cupriavidus oxalaticus TaxID=96344 RepID=A0A5P3VAF9_9BURK|nr:hypothetical protein D2917_00010 [Cupriavidus oxalaticus]
MAGQAGAGSDESAESGEGAAGALNWHYWQILAAASPAANAVQLTTVVPAQAGTQRLLKSLDSRLRGNDSSG